MREFSQAVESAAAEVELEFAVVIQPCGPVDRLSEDGRAALRELMERAQASALQVLNGTARPLSATLAARVQVAIDRWDELAKAEKALMTAFREPVSADQHELQAPSAAHDRAKSAFEDAFNILIALFEKEFPRGHR